MRRNSLQNSGQDLPLQLLQVYLRRFNQSNAAGSFRSDLVMIVLQSRLISLVPKSLEIGEPSQLAMIEQQPVGQRSGKNNSTCQRHL
jgi:hypothetical protein